MLKPKSNALRVVEATLGKITEVKKPVSKFIIHMVELWLGMNCRYVFSNMERWGKMAEKSYRNGFGKFFDWFQLNYALVQHHCGYESLLDYYEKVAPQLNEPLYTRPVRTVV